MMDFYANRRGDLLEVGARVELIDPEGYLQPFRGWAIKGRECVLEHMFTPRGCSGPPTARIVFSHRQGADKNNFTMCVSVDNIRPTPGELREGKAHADER